MSDSPLDPFKDIPGDPFKDILGVDLTPQRLAENLASYHDILKEIRKLRELDLTDVHPAIVFEPTSVYRRGVYRKAVYRKGPGK